MNHWFAVAAGGAGGALARYALSSAVYSWLGRGFPWGTLAVNVIGSGLMGLLFILLVERAAVSAEWRALVLVGFLGAFTTFSTFSMETFSLLEDGELAKASLNVVGSVMACVLATWAGVLIGKALLPA